MSGETTIDIAALEAAPPATQFPPVPATRDDLLIAALRHANVTSGTLNEIRAEVFRLLGDCADEPDHDHIFDLLRRGLGVESGVCLFIAANNLRIELPADLKAESEDV